jgi:hypothetical protein
MNYEPAAYDAREYAKQAEIEPSLLMLAKEIAAARDLAVAARAEIGQFADRVSGEQPECPTLVDITRGFGDGLVGNLRRDLDGLLTTLREINAQAARLRSIG